ncbi:MAG: outer membrane beta-barrel protein [Bacteroidaceae bacterium]|nr:outer membrane beta-barrel protein [Bacteroidaceae bacterium]
MKKVLLLLLLFLSTFAYAQKKNGTITAEIIGKEDGEALTPATVQLFSLPDSVFRVGAVSDLDGKINLKVQSGNYFMKISFVGYITVEKNVTVEDEKTCNVGKISMKQNNTLLDEAVVSAEVPPVTAAEDTLVFNTAAFRVPEGSMLEELIKKYPGVDIAEDGTIKINGKTVNRILMKGKDFFGTDKDVALKNISVDAVDKVKFYDKKSDFARITGIDDGEEETVLDLQMKKGVADGFFSNSDAGGGTDFSAEHLLYRLRNTTSYYNDDAQYTLVLSANNLGDQGFSDGRGRGFRGGGNNGISSPKLAGFNFAYENDKLEIGGNVRANRVKNDVKNWTSTETFMPQIGRNQFSNSRSSGLNGRTNVNANFRFEWKPDTLTNIILTPTISYSNNDSWNESHSATFNENPFDYDKDYKKDSYGEVSDNLESVAVNDNANESLSIGENLSFSARLQVNRRLNKPGRNVTFRGNYSYTDSKSENFSLNNVNYYQAVVTDKTSRQQRFSTTPGNNWSYNLSLSYTEPLLKNLFLQLNYNFSYSYNNSDRATYNFDELADYILEVSPDFTRPILPTDIEHYLDNDLSRYSTYRTQKHEAGVTFRYVTDKMNLNVGVNWLPQQTELDYKYQGIDTLFTRNILNYVSPNIRFRYRWSKQTTLNIRYRGSTSQPSMTDLIDITDDSNPLNITKGNPGLKPSFSNNVNVDFGTYNVDAQRGMNVFARYSNTINAITRKATYDEATGATTTQPENINGNWNVDGGFVFNSAIPANTKFTYSTFTNGGYSERVSYISMQREQGSVKSIAQTVNVSERLTANYRSDNWDISLNGFFSYSHSKSSAQPEDKMNVFNFSYGPSVNYTLPWYNIKISTNLSMSSRRGYSDPSANTDELLWNAQLSASFLPKNALTVSLQLYDILQQQSNISRVVEALYRRDSETNAIYSYCMLNLTYKFNNTGGNDKKGKAAREYGMPPGGMMPPAGMAPPAGMMPPGGPMM